MNWKRYKLLIVVGVISILCSAVLLVLILRAGANTSELRNEVMRLKNQQTQLASAQPFPSEASFVFLQEKKSTIESSLEEIRQAILADQISPITMNRSMFGDYIRTQFVPPLVEGAAAAKAGGENGVILRDPSFGLQSYLDGALPDPQEIPGLMVQLESMRHLSLLMFASGISELVRLEPKQETAQPGARPAAGAGAGLFATQAPGRVPAGVSAPAVDGAVDGAEDGAEAVKKRREELFAPVAFTVGVKVYEDKLWGLLNVLAGDSNQMVVRNLSVTNSNQQIWPGYLRPDPRMGGNPGRGAGARAERRPANPLLAALLEQPTETAPSTEPAVKLPGLQDRRERLVGGELLDVSFDVIFYRLKPVAQGS